MSLNTSSINNYSNKYDLNTALSPNSNISFQSKALKTDSFEYSNKKEENKNKNKIVAIGILSLSAIGAFLGRKQIALGLYSNKIGNIAKEELSKLSFKQIISAINYYNKGIPTSKIADCAVVENQKLVKELLKNNKIRKYYIPQIASLSKENYAKVIDLIENKGLNAPSALSAISKKPEEYNTYVANVLSGKEKMLKEVTPEIEEKLQQLAKILTKEYKELENYPAKDIEELFGKLDTTQALTTRSKGENSALCKLVRKYENGNLDISQKAINEQDISKARMALADAYGARVQMKSLNIETSKQIVEKALKDTGLTYEDFMKSVKKSYATDGKIEEKFKDAFFALKEAQNKETFEALYNGIKEGKIKVSEINNYGNDISSYFTPKQLQKIMDLDVYKTQPLKITNATIPDEILDIDKRTYRSVKTKTKGAIKDSGYTSCQMNIIYQLPEGKTGYGELQIRGSLVNDFGDVEHIPYDIRQGKITSKNVEYKEIYNTIKNMSDESYEEYNKYLTDVYNYSRLKEMGLIDENFAKPILTKLKYKDGKEIPENLTDKLSKEGLLKFKH